MDKRSAIILIVLGFLLVVPSAYGALTVALTGSWAVAFQIIALALLALPLVGFGLIAWGLIRLLRKNPDARLL